jgi:hypothetical protein
MPPLVVRFNTLTMPRFMLVHSHRSSECRVAFAAWRGFDSPLRHAATAGSCAQSPSDTHRIFWSVDAPDEGAAFAHLPPWVAERTVAERVGEVEIP